MPLFSDSQGKNRGNAFICRYPSFALFSFTPVVEKFHTSVQVSPLPVQRRKRSSPAAVNGNASLQLQREKTFSSATGKGIIVVNLLMETGKAPEPAQAF